MYDDVRHHHSYYENGNGRGEEGGYSHPFAVASSSKGNTTALYHSRSLRGLHQHSNNSSGGIGGGGGGGVGQRYRSATNAADGVRVPLAPLLGSPAAVRGGGSPSSSSVGGGVGVRKTAGRDRFSPYSRPAELPPLHSLGPLGPRTPPRPNQAADGSHTLLRPNLTFDLSLGGNAGRGRSVSSPHYPQANGNSRGVEREKGHVSHPSHSSLATNTTTTTMSRGWSGGNATPTTATATPTTAASSGSCRASPTNLLVIEGKGKVGKILDYDEPHQPNSWTKLEQEPDSHRGTHKRLSPGEVSQTVKSEQDMEIDIDNDNDHHEKEEAKQGGREVASGDLKRKTSLEATKAEEKGGENEESKGRFSPMDLRSLTTSASASANTSSLGGSVSPA